MPLTDLLLKSLDKNCSIAITSFSNGSYKVYYSPNGCLKNVNLDTFRGFVFSPFQVDESTPSLYLSPSTTFITRDFSMVERFIESLEVDTPIDLDTSLYISKEKEQKELLEKTIDSIDNKMPKVVISRIQPNSRINTSIQEFLNLCERYPNNGNYIFYTKESGLWIGSSPEILIDIDHNSGNTCALAGTKSSEDQWSKKEQEEQQIVEEYIDQIFQSNSINFNSIKETISLKGIDHIKTSYSFDLSGNFSLKNLITQLHPTPAVAGIPKQKAIDFILNNEPHHRKYYTGYFGVLENKIKKLYVNLRCFQLSELNNNYYLGGGITKDSSAEKEFQETIRKMESLII